MLNTISPKLKDGMTILIFITFATNSHQCLINEKYSTIRFTDL